MTPRLVHVLTESPVKLAAVHSVFMPPAFDVVPVHVDVPEIQADTSLEIARRQATSAARILGVPVVREDHEHRIAALNGMPGPFMAYFNRAVPVETLLEMLEGRDRRAELIMSLVYAEPDGRTAEFTSTVPYEFARVPAGDPTRNFERAMVFPGETRTNAEYPVEERLHRLAANFVALRDYLTSRA